MKRILTVTLLSLLVTSPVWAGRSKLIHSNVTVGTTSIQVIATNTSRDFLLLQNDSANNDMYCKINNPAVVNQGIRLNQGGGSILLDAQWSIGQVNCIATAANGTFLGTEGVGP